MSSKEVSTRPVDQRDRELFAMPPLNAQLPVGFKDGASWHEITGNCEQCGQEIPDKLFRGEIKRPIEKTIVIEGVGLCKVCNLLTRFSWRFHDDARITGLQDGKWCTWEVPKSPWSRFKAWLGWT